ncbi:MAG TPA: carboxypeptidase regulatory-like domain-containing protein [Polyangia bacterium]|nr:carboxypeptidase regulatory-like domain-containing protein [Polyangia bacterium]
MTRVVAIVSVVVIVGVMGWMWRSGADTSTPAPSVNAKATSVTVEPERPAIATVGAATVSGVVKFRGAAPARERVRMSADPYCQRVAGDSEEVIVNANGTLKNVIVRVLGAPAAAPPPTMVSLAQDKCQYRPRVQAMVAGQELRIKNADPVLHNVHPYAGAVTLFNQAQVPGVSPDIVKVVSEPKLIKLKCDVHQWMTGWVRVHENALFAVTGDDGAFSIAGVPPGRYTLEAWHERYGTKRAELVVAAAPSPTIATAFEYSDSDGARP